MKKLLVLVLILAMASVANAGFIFTVNGEPQPDEVWIQPIPSGEIELDLELSDQSTCLSYKLGYDLSNAQAEFIDTAVFPTVFDFAGKTQNPLPGGGPITHIEITASQFMSPAVTGPAVLMNNLYVHCLDETDVILTITSLGGTTVDGEPIPDGTVLHTLTIHQEIPEPATIALLGLGGLTTLLRRRRK